MLVLLSTVFVAALIGSVHCVGMCGPIAIYATSSNCSSGSCLSATSRRIGIYQIGRLISYLILGGAAGLIGASVDTGGSLIGLQNLGTQVAGVTLIAIGLWSLLRMFGAPLPVFHLPQRLSASISPLIQRSTRSVPFLKPFALGLATGMLPCGWLFAFVVAAGATASPLSGIAVMGTFWSGNAIVLTLFQLTVSAASQTFLKRHQGWITATLAIVVGILSLTNRVSLQAMNRPALEATTLVNAISDTNGATESPKCSCCEKQKESESFTLVQNALKDLAEEKLPCCKPTTQPSAKQESRTETTTTTSTVAPLVRKGEGL